MNVRKLPSCVLYKERGMTVCETRPADIGAFGNLRICGYSFSFLFAGLLPFFDWHQKKNHGQKACRITYFFCIFAHNKPRKRSRRRVAEPGRKLKT